MDTPIIGNVGGDQAVQGTGLVLDIATISSEKNIELSQEGLLTLGPTGGAQIIMNPDGTTTAANWNISAAGGATFSTIAGTNGTFSGTLTVQTTSTFTGLGV